MIAENHSHCLSWERRLQIAIDAAEGQYINKCTLLKIQRENYFFKAKTNAPLNSLKFGYFSYFHTYFV
jgi:hypothetical protein